MTKVEKLDRVISFLQSLSIMDDQQQYIDIAIECVRKERQLYVPYWDVSKYYED